MQEQSGSGQQQLAALLHQVSQEGSSGHIFCMIRGGTNGKIEVNKGILRAITYRGKPIDASDFLGFELHQSVLVQHTPDDQLVPSPSVPDIATFIQALETPVAKPENVPEPPPPQMSQPEAQCSDLDSALETAVTCDQMSVDLSGLYRFEKNASQLGEMVVEELSSSGALLRIIDSHTLACEDQLLISFTLDNPAQTIIHIAVSVYSVKGDQIGVQFVNTSTLDHALAAYLGIKWIQA